MRNAFVFLCLSVSVLTAGSTYAQSTSQQSTPATASPQPAASSGLQLPASTPTYPYVKGYLSFIIPWVTFQGKTVTPEFKSATTLGFPFGVLVYYSDHFGFSFEITPSIMWEHQAGKSPASKTSNVLFDPGPMIRFSHGWTFIPRLAFETGGRYGVTPVLNKIVARTKAVNYFLAVSAPMRAGNNAPTSIGANLQVGFIFN
jgi:hypothetical protein